MITLKLKFSNSDEEETICSFEESEINLLEEFLKNAREIESCKIVQMRMPVNRKIHFDNQRKEIRTDSNFPDWELMRSYLMCLRPIILQKEKTNFYKICNILLRRIKAPDIRKKIKEEYRLYEGANIQGTVRMAINGESIIYEDIFTKYLRFFQRLRLKKEPPSAGKKTLLSQREFLEAWGSSRY
jgi:hypothetical protein